MKAILKYPLYRRPQPTNEVEAMGYLPAGSVIEVEKLVNGKVLDGVAIWMQADDAFYYWGGGADFNEASVLMAWDELSESVKIAVLQSLVSDQEYWLKKNIVGFQGCGWGDKNDDRTRGLALSVFVDVKTALPTIGNTIRYKGIDVPADVKEVIGFRHHATAQNLPSNRHPDTTTPMQMGGSISVQDSTTYGSRSLVLRKKIGERYQHYLMTCFHVLLDQYKTSGIYNSNNDDMVVAEVPGSKKNPNSIKVIRDLSVHEGRYSPVFDFAMVALRSNLSFSNAVNNRTFSGFYNLEDLPVLKGKQVFMAGASSISKSARVTDVGKMVFVDGVREFRNVLVTENMSTGGDSGGPVVDEQGKIVGMIIAGNNTDRTIVLPITYLFTNLDYELL